MFAAVVILCKSGLGWLIFMRKMCLQILTLQGGQLVQSMVLVFKRKTVFSGLGQFEFKTSEIHTPSFSKHTYKITLPFNSFPSDKPRI